jgi:predicted nucleotidyltransferase component of viral defense system
MIDPVIKNSAISIRSRLLNKAREGGRPFNEVLQYYANERLLYRLSQSRYAKKFVLKGALLFHVWDLPTLRPTRDIDLLGFTANKENVLVDIFKRVCIQEVPQDGLVFDPDSVKAERIKEDAEYEGVRLRFTGSLGKARLHIQIDVGFSDVVFPRPTVRRYRTILNMPSPELRVYPPETVVAEKLQAMIYLGSINSRMKDFYDLWIISRKFEFKGKDLQAAIRGTFSTRDTRIPIDEPVAFSKMFIREKKTQWNAFLKTNLIQSAPTSFDSLVNDLKPFLLPVLHSCLLDQEFNKNWPGWS